MEEQQLAFDTTPEGLELLADILVAAHVASGVEIGSRDLSEAEQDQIVALAGAILIEVLRLSEEDYEE